MSTKDKLLQLERCKSCLGLFRWILSTVGPDEQPAETSDKAKEAAKKPSPDFKFPSTAAPFNFGSSNAAPSFTGFGSSSSAPSFSGFNSFSSLSKEGGGAAKDEDKNDEPQEEENQDPIARQVRQEIGI